MKYLCYILHRSAFVAFTEIGRIKPMYSGMPLVYRYKASAFPFSCIDNDVFSAKHDCATGFQPAHDTIAALQQSIAFDAFSLQHSRIFLNV